ncbi:hypothetical protein B5M50_04600 [candidate division KSB1 bacterium 4484_219]|nr:MAG: hypothetical protein B5M50_04600 [candidate division KSB1 bacterium 4484_219]RKY88522.1 MAG: hypothetical protein DRQ11_03485 [candidate division KSB1 bacterium]
MLKKFQKKPFENQKKSIKLNSKLTYGVAIMNKYQVFYKKLIITCEGCGKVVYYTVEKDTDVEKIFENFQCPNKCGKNLYAFISIGEFSKAPDEKK